MSDQSAAAETSPRPSGAPTTHCTTSDPPTATSTAPRVHSHRATASQSQRALAREMANFILPRPGATPHHLTVHAAHRMGDLIDRAERFERPTQ